MNEKVIEMINSDDPEIAEIGAKLLVQEGKTQKRIKIPKWFIEFYEDAKGNLHSRFIKKARRNSGIYIKSLQDINNAIGMGFLHNSYLYNLQHLLEYDVKSKKVKEKQL